MSHMEANFLPAARIDGLVTTESGNEVLVYDTQTHVIHHLNPTATTIWRLLDGRQTMESLERTTSAVLGMDVSRDVVEAALTSLDELDLLDGHVTFAAKSASPSRRRFLKRAAAGVAVPVIASITAPAAHASDTPDDICFDCFSPSHCTTAHKCSGSCKDSTGAVVNNGGGAGEPRGICTQS